ncbi:Wzz/FepE/Etk N-terminal domain-containing protein [Paenibacillaceae bacterium WGS1546]|uniref:Wzz/FepE/Etk N-terminal domain-containing protein n=1 Tax=Cohnella sp. WGS1546 TaxID=3366810 RepID=UPI00372D3CEA
MREEISLREILETVWKGKLIIASVTVACMLSAAIIGFFVPPTYEAKANVRVANNPEILLSFVETLSNDATMLKLKNTLQLDSYSIPEVKDAVSIQYVQNTNVAEIKVNGSDPGFVTNVANFLAFELGARIEVTDRANEIIRYKNELLELVDTVTVTKGELAEAEKQLAKTSEKLLTISALADEPYLQSVVQENNTSIGISNRDLGSVSLISEEINPTYTTLESKVAELTIQLGKLAEEMKVKESAIDRHESEIRKVEQEMNSERLRVQQTERMLNGTNAVFVSPSIETDQPTGPNKKLIVAIAMVLGGFFSVMFVLVRHFWKASETRN